MSSSAELLAIIPKALRVLVGCETSGIVRRAFMARGHDVWSCDLLPAEDGSNKRWSRVHRMSGYGRDRRRERSRFYDGIAAAMADQWGGMVEEARRPQAAAEAMLA